MARYATYIRASTDDQKTTHQQDAIDEWLTKHDVDQSDVDRYVDLGQSGADPGREQFGELVDAIQSENYEYVVVWEISRLARLGSIYQRFFEHCEDAGTTVAITDGWINEVRPDGTGKLIADISAAVAEEERRRLTKRIESGVARAQREGKWTGRVPKGFRHDNEGYLQLIHEADRDAGEISYLEMRSAIGRVDDGESYRAVAADTPNIGRSTLMRIHKDDDRRSWYLDGEADDAKVDRVLDSATVSRDKPNSP
jgi:DNA invertase Pin-like site-specific DNA recombinase